MLKRFKFLCTRTRARYIFLDKKKLILCFFYLYLEHSDVNTKEGKVTCLSKVSFKFLRNRFTHPSFAGNGIFCCGLASIKMLSMNQSCETRLRYAFAYKLARSLRIDPIIRRVRKIIEDDVSINTERVEGRKW